MCGISGILGALPGEQLGRRVRRMIGTIAHRGPDAEGVFIGENVALAHRRLSIIDLSAAGAQPMTLGALTLVYNGESYNFTELREELMARGSVFVGHSDTEVVLHAYRQWGIDGLAKLEGMFAFALWDADRRRLVLMRDRLGIKPLFYARSGDCLVFGSEIKALLAGAEVRRSIDDQAFAEYLWYGNAFEDRTLYADVRALPPGHRLLVEGGRQRVEAWWRIESWLERSRRSVDAQAAAAEVREAVDAAVARQLVSDVPVGIFLSGGVDSSSIAASASVGAGRKLRSYAAGFDLAGGVDERPKARQVAHRFGFDHHELQVRGDRIEEAIHALVRAHDEPFADAANIPLYLLAKQLDGAVKVVLQGDGGDEMFAGYRRYSVLRHAAAWQWWPHCIEPALMRVGGRRGVRLARFTAAAGAKDPAERMALLLTVESMRDPPTSLLRSDASSKLAQSTDAFAAYRRCARRFVDHEPVQQMLLTDITLQLPSQFLTKVDRATMAHGLEVRVPLLDEQVAAVAVGLPSTLKVRGVQKKIVLREAMRQRLPADILDGSKTGFGVPYEHWLRTSLYELARAKILAADFVERFALAPQRLQIALEEHRSGRRDRGFLLWKMLHLALWSEEYLR